MKRILAYAALLLAGAIWGGGFVVMKNAIAGMPINFILMLRFGVAAAVMSVFLFKNRERVTKRLLAAGGILGLLQYGAFALQTYGLVHTTAGKNALVTAVYMVLVPFVLWITSRQPPRLKSILAALVCFGGIALLCLGGGDGGINIGDALTFMSSVIYAVYIVLVDRFMREHDMMQLTCVQFAAAAVAAAIPFLLFEEAPASLTPNMWMELAYCCILGTLVALTLQNFGIKYGKPETSSLFMSTEAPFGALFGVIFLSEVMSGRMVAGCALIIAAIVLSQANFGKKKEIRETVEADDQQL